MVLLELDQLEKQTANIILVVDDCGCFAFVFILEHRDGIKSLTKVCYGSDRADFLFGKSYERNLNTE